MLRIDEGACNQSNAYLRRVPEVGSGRDAWGGGRDRGYEEVRDVGWRKVTGAWGWGSGKEVVEVRKKLLTSDSVNYEFMTIDSNLLSG